MPPDTEEEQIKHQLNELADSEQLLFIEREALILANSVLKKQLDEIESKYLSAITVISEIDLKLSYFKRILIEKNTEN